MNNLKRIEGKILQSIDENSSDKNSYLILKFNDGTKINITSSPNGDTGVGQLDIDLNGKTFDDFIGKSVISIVEEFDGENDFITFSFKNGLKMVITSFCSVEKCTASLDTMVHFSDKIVKESINEGWASSQDSKDWLDIYQLVYERTESGDIENESELQLVIDTLRGLKYRGTYKIGDEDIEDAAWEAFNDVKTSLR